MTLLPDNHGQVPAGPSLGDVGRMVAACMQCGTCSASCPNAASMDMTPRRMWRLALLGRGREIFESNTFWMCSNCYTCTLRCPRGLPLTEAMNALKRAANAEGHPALSRMGSFYRAFMDNVRRRGRVRETEMMTRWLMRAGPGKALGFAPLGMKLMRKGKVHADLGSGPFDGVLGPLFEQAARMESPAKPQEDRP